TVNAFRIGYPAATARLLIVGTDSNVNRTETDRICGPVTVSSVDLDLHDISISHHTVEERERVAVTIDRDARHGHVGCAAHIARLEDLKRHLRERDVTRCSIGILRQVCRETHRCSSHRWTGSDYAHVAGVSSFRRLLVHCDRDCRS